MVPRHSAGILTGFRPRPAPWPLEEGHRGLFPLQGATAPIYRHWPLHHEGSCVLPRPTALFSDPFSY